jgi:ethanolamine utilization cobalamin adenosyltransferase
VGNYKYIFNVEGRNYVIDTKEILHLSQQQLEEINKNGKPQLCHDIVLETTLKAKNIVSYNKSYK